MRLSTIPEGIDEEKDGTGLMVLKCQNFKNRQVTPVELQDKEKLDLFQIMERDSEMLRKNGLIDYSVFLVEVKDSRGSQSKNEMIKSMFYCAFEHRFKLKELNIRKSSSEKE